ncbi:MAG: archease [Actinomycetota bacterium]|nr:archease [Actinomycetota bacterium]
MGNYKPLLDASGFAVSGASLIDLFETAAQAMFAVEYDTSTVGFEREVGISGTAEDIDALLLVWLRELLAAYSVHGFVPGDFMVIELGEPPLRRYGQTGMAVRGRTRGRDIGDWFVAEGPRIVEVSAEPLEVSKRRTKFSTKVWLELGD